MTRIDVERLEQSKDPRLRRFLAEAVEFLAASGLPHAAFGSCAAFAHRGRVRRLVRDLDVILPRRSFERLEEIARSRGFDAERERTHFVRMRRDIYQVHAVPEVYQQYDYRTREQFALVDTGIEWSRVETRQLRFVTGLEPLALPVAPRETLIALGLLRPLNTNSIDDLAGLLAAPFDGAGLRAFVARNPVLRPLLVGQLERLAQLVSEGRVDDDRKALPAALQRARAAFEAAPGENGCRA